MRVLFFLISLLFCLQTSTLVHAEDRSVIGRMQSITPCIVEVRTVLKKVLTTKNGRKGIASYERHGAGIIIDPSGIIVTNTHIIANAPQILVGLSNGKVYEASVLYINESDFSFIKIDPPSKLKAISWADSSTVPIGEPILAIGNSDYDNQSILGGQITSLIESMSTNAIEMLEVNLNLYQGDSGGPILNKQGQLLGLIMGKRQSQERRSYAIASNKIRQEYLKLKQNMP